MSGERTLWATQLASEIESQPARFVSQQDSPQHSSHSAGSLEGFNRHRQPQHLQAQRNEHSYQPIHGSACRHGTRRLWGAQSPRCRPGTAAAAQPADRRSQTSAQGSSNRTCPRQSLVGSCGRPRCRQSWARPRRRRTRRPGSPRAACHPSNHSSEQVERRLERCVEQVERRLERCVGLSHGRRQQRGDSRRGQLRFHLQPQ